MNDPSLAAAPPYGSVESYARILRRSRAENREACALDIILIIADDHSVGHAVRIARIRNVVAAVNLIDAVSAVLPGDASGFEFSREQGPEDGALTQPGRIPQHNGGMTEGGLVDETAPVAQHVEAGGWKGAGPGGCGVECSCGVTFDGFDSLDEAAEQLALHIEASA